MAYQLERLENEHWQVGILPETGASIAFGRVRQGSEWVDVLRPTPERDYGNSSNCSSFIMLPWCNRIKGGVLRFGGREHQLETTKDDGTARHGDVRKRTWTVDVASQTHIRMSLQSADFLDMNWPFRFSASAAYRLEGQDFIWELALKNVDTQDFPAGFGHHPYFVKVDDVQLQIPCSQYFVLTNYMATAAPVSIKSALDFRQMRRLPDYELNHLLTGRKPGEPAIIRYPQWGIELVMQADLAFEHILIFAPEGKFFFAVEPMTNASDGFNLYADGIPGSGVFVLQPGEEKRGSVKLALRNELAGD
jgi:aldose 1-epimerase